MQLKNNIVLATNNKDKIKEIKKLLGGKYNIITLKNPPSVLEDGNTLEENAVKKAMAFYKVSGMTVIADDTGLEVKALDWQPGVRSARFAGEKSTYADNVKKLLFLLRGIPYKNRFARFRTVMAVVFANGTLKIVKGRVSGYIIEKPTGKRGFGFDPVFYYPPFKKTFAEMTLTEKNSVSHRGKALKSMQKIIKNYFKN
ncbi:MAG: Non-canonical purine NTP pyrophosphatase [Elusimicrobia bacterium ADurb.Bin231]|nr:MAG: Non-canonical purine NTP pyrophosphatase [Elusimicrobia bacterium ADurb.Bin231]